MLNYNKVNLINKQNWSLIMKINTIKLILLQVIIASIALTGCGKKETPKEIAKEQKEYIISKSDIQADIMKSFPSIFDYVYISGKLISQESVKFERDYSTPKEIPDYKSSLLMIESEDSIDKIYEFYKKLFSQDNIRTTMKNGGLSSVFCSYINNNSGINNVPLEIQLKVTQPYTNFSENILESQISTVNNQISQYEKILQAQIQRKNLMDNDSPELKMVDNAITHCKTQIEKLKNHVEFLKNKSSVIELRMTYLYANVKKPLN